MFCSKCGKQIDDDSDFCKKCGAPQRAGATARDLATAGEFELYRIKRAKPNDDHTIITNKRITWGSIGAEGKNQMLLRDVVGAESYKLIVDVTCYKDAYGHTGHRYVPCNTENQARESAQLINDAIANL